MPRASLAVCAALLSLLPGFARGAAADLAPDGGVAVDDATRVYELKEEFAPRHIQDAALARDLADKTERSAPAVVVSGGISLGAYQAGFVSTLVRFWSLAQPDGAGAPHDSPAPRVWTGASAGAVNALLGGLASCDGAFAQPRWSPEDSLFWEVWIEKLTNLRGRDVTFGEGGSESRAQLKRVTERLVAQVTTHGKGQLTARQPFVADATSATPPYIAMDSVERHYYPALGTTRPDGEGGQSISLEDLMTGPRASGSFPLAFPPTELSASFFNPESGWGTPEVLSLPLILPPPSRSSFLMRRARRGGTVREAAPAWKQPPGGLSVRGLQGFRASRSSSARSCTPGCRSRL